MHPVVVIPEELPDEEMIGPKGKRGFAGIPVLGWFQRVGEGVVKATGAVVNTVIAGGQAMVGKTEQAKKRAAAAGKELGKGVSEIIPIASLALEHGGYYDDFLPEEYFYW